MRKGEIIRLGWGAKNVSEISGAGKALKILARLPKTDQLPPADPNAEPDQEIND
jgi:hypothetical protein